MDTEPARKSSSALLWGSGVGPAVVRMLSTADRGARQHHFDHRLENAARAFHVHNLFKCNNIICFYPFFPRKESAPGNAISIPAPDVHGKPAYIQASAHDGDQGHGWGAAAGKVLRTELRWWMTCLHRLCWSRRAKTCQWHSSKTFDGMTTSGICFAAGHRKAYTNALSFFLTYVAGKLPEIVSTCCGSAT